MRRIALSDAEIAAIAAGRFVRVDLGGWMRAPDGGVTRSALVGRAGGRLVAWANLCQHNPVPLDLPDVPEPDERGVRGAPMSDDGASFVCHSHGAIYRPSDGKCVLGPCYGQALWPLAVDEDVGGARVAIRIVIDDA